ncbi:TPA: GPO family capsid scaffolding protein [Enterobacter asburiae]|nr:GPO family capsid scaffolding protein [Enterobacter asburiae]
MSQLSTDWLCIATEGDTVDRRELKREWLIDAAETYDPELYGALIWPEHERGYGNLGSVTAAMWQEGDDGLVRLYAKICPNMYLIEANKRDQLVYFSVELTEDGDFRGTGRSYLEGLAATDSPASVGTTRMRFNKRKKNRSGCYRYKFGRNGKVEQETEMSWHKMFGITPKKFADDIPTDAPQDGDKLQALAEALNNLEGRVAALESQVTSTQEDVDTIAEVVDTEDFATLRDNISTVIKNFSKLDNKITQLPKHKRGENPKGRKFNFL